MIERNSKQKKKEEEEETTGFNGPVVGLLHRGGNFLDDDSADGVPAGVRISPWGPLTVADVELDLHSSTPDASTVAFDRRNAVDVVVFTVTDNAIDSSRDCALGAVESEEPTFAAAGASLDAQSAVICDVKVGGGTYFVKRAFLSKEEKRSESFPCGQCKKNELLWSSLTLSCSECANLNILPW